MNEYSYDGPVLYFDKCYDRRWKGKTFAVSEAKARSNLAYQWKMEHGFSAHSKITLPGDIVLVKSDITYIGEQLKLDI